MLRTSRGLKELKESKTLKIVQKDLTDDRTAHSKFIQYDTVDVLGQTLFDDDNGTGSAEK